MEWAVSAAMNANHVDLVIVSSDDAEILEFAEKLGAIPHLRPSRLATDVSTVEVGVIDVLKNNQIAIDADLIVLVQATSPLTRSSDIDSAIEHLERKNLDSILSVSSSHIFQWQVTDNLASPINYDPKKRPRRQDMKNTFQENGAFYIAKKEIWEKESCRLGGRVGVQIMEEWQSYELDSENDWRILEKIASDLAIDPESIR